MDICKNCGSVIKEEQLFCTNCGTRKPNREIKKTNEREIFFDGKIHKCPSCGSPLKSFSSICEECGAEVRSVGASRTVESLHLLLAQSRTEEQRIRLIKTFPIPNTKEDILELLILATSNFDALYHAKHLNEEDVSDAWLIKIDQCYQKAKFIIRSEEDFLKIEELYSSVQEKISFYKKKQKKQKKSLGVIITIGVCLMFIPNGEIKAIGLLITLAGAISLLFKKKNKKQERYDSGKDDPFN